MQWLERHHHLSGGTIWVRDDVLLRVFLHRFRIYLWHHQRHFGIIAIKRGVIDHHTPGSSRLGRIDLRGVRTDGKERDVPTSEIKRVDIFRRQRLLTKRDLCTQRAARGQSGKLIHRKPALGQDAQHFTAHIACGTGDDDFVSHFEILQYRDVPEARHTPNTGAGKDLSQVVASRLKR